MIMEAIETEMLKKFDILAEEHTNINDVKTKAKLVLIMETSFVSAEDRYNLIIQKLNRTTYCVYPDIPNPYQYIFETNINGDIQFVAYAGNSYQTNILRNIELLRKELVGRRYISDLVLDFIIKNRFYESMKVIGRMDMPTFKINEALQNTNRNYIREKLIQAYHGQLEKDLFEQICTFFPEFKCSDPKMIVHYKDKNFIQISTDNIPYSLHISFTDDHHIIDVSGINFNCELICSDDISEIIENIG